MIFSTLIISLFILRVCLSAPNDDGSSSISCAGHANRRPDCELIKFDYLDTYRDQGFAYAYLNGFYEVSQEDLCRFERFKAELPDFGEENGFQMYLMLREMVVRGSLESFKVLYPHIRFGEDYKYDVLLMAECANYNRHEILDFIMKQGFEPQRFMDGIRQLSEYLAIPRGCIGIVDMVALRNAEVQARKGEIYKDMLQRFLFEEDGLHEYSHLCDRDDEEEIGDLEEFIHDRFVLHYAPSDVSGASGSRRPDFKRKRDGGEEDMVGADSEGSGEKEEESLPSKKRTRMQID